MKNSNVSLNYILCSDPPCTDLSVAQKFVLMADNTMFLPRLLLLQTTLRYCSSMKLLLHSVWSLGSVCVKLFSTQIIPFPTKLTRLIHLHDFSLMDYTLLRFPFNVEQLVSTCTVVIHLQDCSTITIFAKRSCISSGYWSGYHTLDSKKYYIVMIFTGLLD